LPKYKTYFIDSIRVSLELKASSVEFSIHDNKYSCQRVLPQWPRLTYLRRI